MKRVDLDTAPQTVFASLIGNIAMYGQPAQQVGQNQAWNLGCPCRCVLCLAP